MDIRENYFNQYEEKQRNIIKKILFKIVGSYKIANRKESVEDISNVFLQKVAKPQWFNYNIKTIRDIYLYIKYIDSNWNKYSKYFSENKIRIKKYSEIIDEEKRIELKHIIDEIGDYTVNISLLPAQYKKVYKGQSIKDMDLNYICNNEYSFIKSLLNAILEQKNNQEQINICAK